MTKRGAPQCHAEEFGLRRKRSLISQSLLVAPPVLEGEDASAYEALKFRILSAVKSGLVAGSLLSDFVRPTVSFNRRQQCLSAINGAPDCAVIVN